MRESSHQDLRSEHKGIGVGGNEHYSTFAFDRDAFAASTKSRAPHRRKCMLLQEVRADDA